MGNKTLLIVVDPVIKKTFKRACKEAHTPMNVAIQRFMIEYSKLDLKTRLKQNLEDLDRVVEEAVESKMEEINEEKTELVLASIGSELEDCALVPFIREE